MKLSEAIIDAFEVIKNNKDYVLCGSLALILKGVIPQRDVHDIDFVVEKDKVDLEDLKSKSYKSYKDNDEYYCFFILEDEIEYDLFVFKDDRKIEVKNMVIPTQDEKDILECKKTYGRGKDIFDLSFVGMKTTKQSSDIYMFINLLGDLKILDGPDGRDYSKCFSAKGIGTVKRRMSEMSYGF